MLAGGQIAGVSGHLPRCFELKPSRSHASGVTPQHDRPWLKDWGDEMIACPDSVAKAGVSSACLSVHPSGSKAMSKFYTW